MKGVRKKLDEIGRQCSLCSAKFEIWLNNAKISDEKKEKIQRHFLSYCPACVRVDERRY